MALRPIKVVKVLIIVAGAAAVAWAIWRFGGQGRNSPGQFYIMGPALAAVALYLAANWYDHAERRRQLLGRLIQMGFSPLETGANPPHALVFYAPEKRHHGFRIRLVAEADWHGRRARLAEYQYLTGRGKNQRTWRHCVAAIECPPAWPEFTLEPPLGFASRPISELFSGSGETIGDKPFDDRWRISSPDRGGALAAVNPAVRAWLADAPSGETWWATGGMLACTWPRVCDEKSAEQLLARVATFLAKAGGGA